MRRFEVLDSLRGISAVLVVVYHLDQDVLTHWRNAAFINHLDLMVDFFFVLSGFVIASAYGARLARGGEVVPFMLRRIGRIYPLHVAVLFTLIAFALVRAFGSGSLDPRAAFGGGIYDLSAIFTNLLLLQGVGFENHLTWNYPSWSISAEMWAYLLFAIIWSAFAARSLAIAATLALVCPLLVALFPTDSLSPMTFVRVAGGFAMGVVVREIFVRAEPKLMPWIEARRLGTALELGAVALIATFVAAVGALWLAPFVFAIAVFVFALEAGRVSRLLRLPPMLKMGQVSYSIYMTHAALIMMMWPLVTSLENVSGLALTTPIDGVRLWATEAWIGDLVVAAMVGLVIAVSTATYRWIEQPGQAWGQAMAESWKAQRPTRRGSLSEEGSR